MEKTFVQSVDGVVNLIGGPEVGLFGPVSDGRVVVREATGNEKLGWVDDGAAFVPPLPVESVPMMDPIQELREMIEELALAVLQSDGAVVNP